MRRFEFSDGKSNKFWEIEVEGDSFVTRYGRIGSNGSETRKQCVSSAAAEKQAASAIASKLKKGYVEVGGDAGAKPAAAPAKAKSSKSKSAAKGKSSKSEAAVDGPIAKLEHKLAAEPEAFDDWLVYADALSQTGDPRGELIVIGVSLLRGEGKATQLRAREDQLLQANADAWFGKFVSDDDWRECFGWTLQTGFWGRIRFWVDYDHTGTDIPGALAYALSHPSCKFLRQLDLGLTSAEGDADYDRCIRALVKHGPMPSLRRLDIGDFTFPEESEISWVQVGDVGKLWPLYPELDELTLQGGSIRLGAAKHDKLRTLVLRTGGLPAAAGQALGKAQLPALESLSVWFGTTNYGGSCTPAHARGILDNPSLANLTHLALANADFADGIATEVARGKWPAKLQTLDLSMGTMTDAGAERLLRAAKQLGKLASIDLSKNFLSSGMCTRIKRELPNASVDAQKTSDGDWYYVTVGE